MGLADSCCLEFMGTWDVQWTTVLQGFSGLGRLSPVPSQHLLLPVNFFSGSHCYIHKLSYLLNPFTKSDTEGASMTTCLEILKNIDLILNENGLKKEKKPNKIRIGQEGYEKASRKPSN